MTNHTQLINTIALKIQAKSYLEIGTNNCKNFNSIFVVHKMGVDPDLTSPCAIHKTSDEFFKDNKETFDLIFIDGLHHADQVKRDIQNSHECLTEKGVIVIHDCNPSEEKFTHVPRDSKVWNGDVYKAVSAIKGHIYTLDFDYGCCILKKGWFLGFQENNLCKDWESFDKNRKVLLNLLPVEEGLKLIESWT
jgi:hypothetical protein